MTDSGLTELRANTVQVDGVAYVVYPVVWCDRCQAARPHHGPYCMSCGAPSDGETP